MKQSIKTIVVSLFFGLGILTLSFGQNMVAANTTKSTGITYPVAEHNNIETVMEANFSSLFPNASVQKWTSNGSSSFVSFLNEGRKATASFNAKGNMNYAIINCGINNLPAAFSKAITSDYAGYQLFNASEIKAHGQTAYQAVLENATGFVTLKYTVDGVEEIQTVKK